MQLRSLLVFLISGLLAFFPVERVHGLTFDRLDQSQVVTDTAGGPSTANVLTSSNVIGGFRTLRTQTTSAGGFINTVIDQGVIAHSQSASQGGALGFTVIAWDGDTDTNSINFKGLGGVDLTEDQGTGLRVGIEFYDTPGEQAHVLVRLYDASDSFGDTYSEYSFSLSGHGGLPFTKDLPFATPTAVGFGGPANIKNIGAITLTIDGRAQGAGAADIVVNFIGTNGNCDRVPVGGTALDKCGVCGGDNTSCLNCTTIDITDLLQRLDNGAKEQEDVVKRALRVLRKVKKDSETKRYMRKTRRSAHKLQITNWQRTWFNDTSVAICENVVLCSQQDTGSTAIMEAYRIDALKLYEFVPEIIAMTGISTKKTSKLLGQADSIYQAYYAMSFEVPATTSVCNTQ